MERTEWEVGFDPQYTVEQHCLRVDLCDGTLYVGCLERHGNNPESFVGLLKSQPQLQISLTANSFQEVQELSALQAALRFLPNVIVGAVLNIGTGLLVHRLHADHLVLVTSILSAASPLLMAIIDPSWSWWYCAFWAVLLGPLSADGEFADAPWDYFLTKFAKSFSRSQT